MHRRNLTTTFDEGRINTCLLPRFSALEIVLRQSANTDIRTIYDSGTVTTRRGANTESVKMYFLLELNNVFHHRSVNGNAGRAAADKANFRYCLFFLLPFCWILSHLQLQIAGYNFLISSSSFFPHLASTSLCLLLNSLLRQRDNNRVWGEQTISSLMRGWTKDKVQREAAGCFVSDQKDSRTRWWEITLCGCQSCCYHLLNFLEFTS